MSRVTAILVMVVMVTSIVKGHCPDIVSKEGWNASAVSVRENLSIPVPYVVVHHTYIPGACNTSVECVRSMRAMQTYHQGKGWNDIGYNFVIGGDDKVYEGRGWTTVGAHSPKYNYMSIGISFIGDYRSELPTPEMLDLCHSLIACGVTAGYIAADYKLIGHRQVRATECPGDALYSHIQTWPHWENMTDIVPREVNDPSDVSALINLITNNVTEPAVRKEAGCPDVVTKIGWNASPASGGKNLSIPVPYVVVHHTYIPGACNTSVECVRSMRAMQTYHQGKGWGDIGYNFVIGGDNKVYEGRGWDVQGVHSSKYNSKSLGIAFIGDYRDDAPTQDMLDLATSLIACGMFRGSISPDYKLVGNDQAEALRRVLQSSSHWENPADREKRDVDNTQAPDNSATTNTTEQAPAPCPQLVSKADWHAAPVLIKENLTIPVPFVVLHHTYHPAACNTSETCARSVRGIQWIHQAKGWNDIGYNFVIGGDNNVYEGRGWDIVGAHSPTYNFKSIGIAFIGDYRTELPSEEMLNLAKSLIECGVSRGSIKADYKVVGHRQVRATECPGQALYDHIQTWSHWDPIIDIIPRTSSTTNTTQVTNTTTVQPDS